MHYYQFNIGDYQSHTGHLTEIEDLAYRRLLDLSYLHEKPLPDDIDQIARLIRMRSHSDCIAVVLQEYFVRTDEGWVNERVLREIESVNAKSQKARDSALARWQAKAMRTHSECNATQDTRPITQDTEHKKKATVVAAPEGVSQSVWDDFVKHRKAKKAQVTQTVIDGIAREAQKAGWPLEDALKETILRNWASFKADWVANKSFAFQRDDIARVTVPGPKEPDPALLKIQQDREKSVPMPAHIRQQINQVLRKA